MSIITGQEYVLKNVLDALFLETQAVGSYDGRIDDVQPGGWGIGDVKM